MKKKTPGKSKKKEVTGDNKAVPEAPSKTGIICHVPLGEIKETIMQYCNRRRVANALWRFTNGLRIEEDSVKTALEELVKDGRIRCENGFYISVGNKKGS